MEKFQEVIAVTYYYAGSGYGSTEIASNEVITIARKDVENAEPEDYRDWVYDWTEGHSDDEDRWYGVSVEYYEENADQMVDEPIKTVEFYASWEDGELKIEED